MILFRKIRQTGILKTIRIFSTKPDHQDTKSYFPSRRRGLVVLTTTSAWLWYNSSTSPTSGRRRLDLFSPQFRENSSKVLFSMFLYLLQDHQELVDVDGISYTERLTKIIVETFLKRNKVMFKFDPEYQRVARIADMLVKKNLEMKLDPPEFHITTGKSLQAFSLASHIILSQGTLDMWTDTQLAFIIGHEMSHHVLDHHAENLSWLCVEMVVAVMVILYIIRRRVLMLAIIWIVLKPFRLIVSYPLRRMGELEADDLGMEMMARACYDVREAIMFWQVVEFINPTSTRIMAMVSDHPSHSERKNRMVERMKEMVTLRKEAGCEDLDDDFELEKILSAISSWEDI